MITVKLKGGLGNQMFQYAFGKYLAKKLNSQFQLDIRYLLDRTPIKNYSFRDYDLDIFNLQVNLKSKPKLFSHQVYFSKLWEIIILKMGELLNFFHPSYYVERTLFMFDDAVNELSPNCYVSGYFQSYKYVEPIEKELKSDFHFNPKLCDQEAKILAEIMDSESVCVHVRRGDMLTLSGIDTDLGYFERALKSLEEIKLINHLFVFSDDIEWCKSNFTPKIKTTFVDPKFAGRKASHHFFFMLNCKHFIISVSSFAWWAAFLGNSKDKVVFVSKSWCNFSTKKEELFPPSWIKI